MNKIPKIVLIVLAIILLIWLPIIPINVVPEVTLRVVDEDKNPVSNVTVTQGWMHYSFESTASVYKEDHNDKVVSGMDGLVTFSEKNIRISVFKFFLGKLAEILYKIIPLHTSIGSSNSFGTEGYLSEDKWCYPPEKCGSRKISREIIIKKKIQ